MKPRVKNSIYVALVGTAIGASAFFATAKETVIEQKGTVSQILMNPEGDADGLLLENGLQVKFPPHLSMDLRAAVAPADLVTIKGVEERGKVVRAQTITNDKSGKAVVDTPPAHARGEKPPPPPRGGPKERLQGLTELAVKGKIKNQLFGPRGDVNAVILTGGEIVRVGPRVTDGTKVKLEVGQTIEAKGFGTKNEFGQSIEATELKQ